MESRRKRRSWEYGGLRKNRGKRIKNDDWKVEGRERLEREKKGRGGLEKMASREKGGKREWKNDDWKVAGRERLEKMEVERKRREKKIRHDWKVEGRGGVANMAENEKRGKREERMSTGM